MKSQGIWRYTLKSYISIKPSFQLGTNVTNLLSISSNSKSLINIETELKL